MVNPNKEAIIVAGPNGSGKSTFVNGLSDIFSDIRHINPDDILRNLKLPETNDNYLIAFKEAEEQRKMCLKNGISFIIETVFSTQDKIDFVEQCKNAGFSVTIFYLATSEPAINNIYVFDRVEKGGHAVPMNKIISRYYKSMENITKVLTQCDCVLFIDNSVMNEEPILFSALAHGHPCYTNPKETPQWIETILMGVKNLPFVVDTEKQAKCEFFQTQIDKYFLMAVENQLFKQI